MKKEKPTSYQIIAILLFFLSTFLAPFVIEEINSDLGAVSLLLAVIFGLPVPIIIHGIGEIVKQLKILNSKTE
mgnify:CR=1 FL=1